MQFQFFVLLIEFEPLLIQRCNVVIWYRPFLLFLLKFVCICIFNKSFTYKVTACGRLTNSTVALKEDEQLQIIRFGVNYNLSLKESDITDDDIDKILAYSEEKTAEENKKLEDAQK